MDSEVTLAHITETYAARASADDKYKKDQEHDERIEFKAIIQSLSPQFYDATNLPDGLGEAYVSQSSN